MGITKLNDLPKDKKKRKAFFDQKAEQVAESKQEELLVDFDASQKEARKAPKRIVFEGEKFLVPAEAPTDVAMFTARAERSDGITGKKTRELLDLLFGSLLFVDNPSAFTEGEKLLINGDRRNDYRLNYIADGRLQANGSFSVGDVITGTKSDAKAKIKEVIRFLDLMETSKYPILKIESNLLSPIFKEWGFHNAKAVKKNTGKK